MLEVTVYEENDLMKALLHEWLAEAGYRLVPGSEPADLVIASVIDAPARGFAADS